VRRAASRKKGLFHSYYEHFCTSHLRPIDANVLQPLACVAGKAPSPADRLTGKGRQGTKLTSRRTGSGSKACSKPSAVEELPFPELRLLSLHSGCQTPPAVPGDPGGSPASGSKGFWAEPDTPMFMGSVACRLHCAGAPPAAGPRPHGVRTRRGGCQRAATHCLGHAGETVGGRWPWWPWWPALWPYLSRTFAGLWCRRGD
jgi:hypothetical protein